MPRRRPGPLWAAAAAAVAAAVAGAAPPTGGYPVRAYIPKEEEDPAPPPLGGRVELADDRADEAAAVNAYYVRLAAVDRVPDGPPDPALADFLKLAAVAHDRVSEKPRRRPVADEVNGLAALGGVAAAANEVSRAVDFRPYRVTPLPLLWGRDKFPGEFGVVPLSADDRATGVKPLTADRVLRVSPFERLVADEARRLVDPPADRPAVTGRPRLRRLAAAERVLADTLRFHDRARELGKRTGGGWDAVRKEVADRLADVRVRLVREAAAAGDWEAARAVDPAADPRVAEAAFAAKLAEAEQAAGSDRLADVRRARDLLLEYDARFPGGRAEAADRVRARVRARAEKLLADAGRLAARSPADAQALLKEVEQLDPDLGGLRQMQQELRGAYGVLVVGARRMPERLAPAAARFDSERQVAQLLFEGLLEAVPDPDLGTRYAPALAADLPRAAAGGRAVRLVGSAAWAGPDRTPVDPADVAATVRLLADRPGRPGSEPAFWLGPPAADPAAPAGVRVPLAAGHPDPRAVLTFPVLPGRWLAERGLAADDRGFAGRPVGSGPFRLPPDFRPPLAGERPAAVAVVSDPGYGRRPGRLGQPFLKEVRFADLGRLGDPAKALRDDRLHLLTDLPTADFQRLRADPGLAGRVRLVTAAVNRRLWVLAVNHRRPVLRSADLRRGLSLAVDRDRLLADVFRAGDPGLHQPLAGPFPPATWAEPRPSGGRPGPLFSPDLAKDKLGRYREAGGRGALSLLYPADDPQAKAACEAVRRMVAAADAGVVISPEPADPADLWVRVADEHRYDLAYWPVDFPDDWYPQHLAAVLDPAAADPGGRNVFGFRADGTAPTADEGRLGEVLAEVRAARDPARLTALAHDAFERFNQVVPFVPLWRLDRHMAIATSVKVFVAGRTAELDPKWLDPTTPFTSIARWRIE